MAKKPMDQEELLTRIVEFATVTVASGRWKVWFGATVLLIGSLIAVAVYIPMVGVTAACALMFALFVAPWFRNTIRRHMTRTREQGPPIDPDLKALLEELDAQKIGPARRRIRELKDAAAAYERLQLSQPKHTPPTAEIAPVERPLSKREKKLARKQGLQEAGAASKPSASAPIADENSQDAECSIEPSCVTSEQFSNLQRQVAVAQMERREAERQLADVTRSRDALLDTVAALELQLDTLQTEKAALSRSVTLLEETRLRLSETMVLNAQAKRSIEQLEINLAEARAAQQHAAHSARKEVDSLTALLASSVLVQDTLRGQVSRLNEQLKEDRDAQKMLSAARAVFNMGPRSMVRSIRRAERLIEKSVNGSQRTVARALGSELTLVAQRQLLPVDFTGGIDDNFH